MKKTKIDWCDCTINPVVGCPRLCGAKFNDKGEMTKKPWCYAYNMNARFGWVKDFSKPQFFPERLKQLDSKKPKSVFMNSMSDIAFWQDEWADDTYQAMKKNPQHKYIFLTKGDGAFTFWDKNVFNGKTITKQRDIDNTSCFYDFFSIEPILEPINIKNNTPFSNWISQIIIGAETGNRKGKVIPQKQWIDDIVKQADKYGIRVFMKESLRRLMGKDFRQDRLIWEVSK